MAYLIFALLASYAPKVHGSTPSHTPFAALGCHAAAPLDSSSIWQGGSGKWPSCDQAVRSDGARKCIRSNGQADETSLFLDMTSVGNRGGCFAWQVPDCGTDLTRVSKIEFDFDFVNCHDVWTAPLWLTPEVWIWPGPTSGEIDFVEMCPVGNASTNFAGPGQPGENQMIWGSGLGTKVPKHFTLTLDTNGDLTTRICNLHGGKCFNGAYYKDFLNSISHKHNHHFVSDVWNGHGGDGGWTGCQAKHNPRTQCMYAIMNLRVHTRDGEPFFGNGKCLALNGGSNSSADDALIV